MTYYLVRGNGDFLSGEVVIYAHCLRSDKRPFFSGLFASTDVERLEKFQSYEKNFHILEDKSGVVLPTWFTSEDEIKKSGVLNIVKVDCITKRELDDLVASREICKEFAMSYLAQYLKQIKTQYDIDFYSNQNYTNNPRVFTRNLDLLVKKMLDGFNTTTVCASCGEDSHKGEAASSLIRIMCKEKEGCYDDAVLMTKWARPSSATSFRQKENVVHVLREKIEANICRILK